jgi:hypothetical protein
MTDLPKVSYPMTDIEIIILSLILALIATIIFHLICMFIWFVKDSYRILSEFKRQLNEGEITLEEYNRKISEFNEKCKSGEIDRK